MSGVIVKEDKDTSYSPSDKVSVCILNPDTVAKVCFKDLNPSQNIDILRSKHHDRRMSWDPKEVNEQADSSSLQKELHNDIKSVDKGYLSKVKLYALTTGCGMWSLRQGDKLFINFNPHDFKITSTINSYNEVPYAYDVELSLLNQSAQVTISD